jgi:hypothetical protein
MLYYNHSRRKGEKKMKSPRWQIESHWINDNGICETYRFNQVYTNLDEAVKAYEDYVRLCTNGWYDLIEITEKVISL